MSSHSDLEAEAPPELVKGTNQRRRRKRKENPDEHGNSWAKGKKWDFLESRLGLYYDACTDRDWDGFYERSVDAWVEQGFRLEDIGKEPLPPPAQGEENTYNKQLKRKAKNCIKFWYKNRKSKPQNGGAGHKKLKHLLKQGKQRALQPGQGYCHLYYDDPERDMKRKVEEGYAQYLSSLKANDKPMSKLTYRMQFVRELLAKEPPEVQLRVEKYCRSVSSPSYEEKDEYVNYPEEEQIRLANALATRRNAESIPQMVRAFLDAIYEATGFRGVVGLVGPDPLGADIFAHSIILSKGRTRDTNKSYERYSLDSYNAFLTSLRAWGSQCITDSEREAYSLKPVMAPIVDSSIPFDVVEAISKNATPCSDDQPDAVDSFLATGDASSIIDSTPSTLSDNEDDIEVRPSTQIAAPPRKQQETSPTFDTYQDLLEQDSHSFDWDPKLLMPSGQAMLPPDIHPQQTTLYYDNSFMPSAPHDQLQFAHVQNQASYSQVQPVASFDISSMMQPSLTSTRAVASHVGFLPTAGSVDVNAYYSNIDELPQPTHDGNLNLRLPALGPANAPSVSLLPTIHAVPRILTEPGQHREASHLAPPIGPITAPACSSNKENHSPVTNTPKSQKGTPKSGGKKVVPRPKARSSLPKKTGDPAWCLKACDHLRRFLKGPDACEAVVRWKSLEESLGYLAMTKKLVDSIAQTNAPDCLQEYIATGRSDDFEPERDADNISQQFKVFWCGLQPDWRQRGDKWPLSKQSTDAADWSKLLKGGPNGFFVVLKVLSFWAKMAWTREERSDFEQAMTDVNWVLGELLKQVNGGSVLGVRKRRV